MHFPVTFKRLFCLKAGLLFGAVSWSQSIYFKKADNSQDTYATENVRSISFSPGVVHLYLNDQPVIDHELETLRYISFKDHTLSIAEARQGKGISVSLYPNPAQQVVNIKLEQPFAGVAAFQIAAIDGRVLQQGSLAGNKNTYQFSVASLSAGMYICRIIAGQKTTSLKFIKE